MSMLQSFLLEVGPAENIQMPFSTPARWVGQLGRSLRWQKLLQYEFKRPNHINLNENLAYRSLLKHVAKTHAQPFLCHAGFAGYNWLQCERQI